jgi:serine phosphatase RsbU (regulator of sigma subunit)
MVSHVLADIRQFTAGAKQSDDITVLAARYLATP